MLSKITDGKSPQFLTVLVVGVVAASLLTGLGMRLSGGSVTTPNASLAAPLAAGPAVVSPGTPQGSKPRTYGVIGFTAHAHPKTAPKKSSAPATYSTGARVARRPAGVAPKSRTVHGPTSWSALNAAIARIPGYRTGGAHWVVTARYGHWGATDLATGTVYISPNAPTSRLDSIARHEWAHVIQGRVYGHQPRVAFAAMNRAFGGSGLIGTERAADCMARLLGASWTNYTSCSSPAWRASARALLAGRRV